MVLNSDAAHILQHDHQSSSHRPLSRYSLQARGELIILTSMDPAPLHLYSLASDTQAKAFAIDCLR